MNAAFVDSGNLDFDSLPDFWTSGQYQCDPYIAAAMRLQEMGYDAAIDQMAYYCKDKRLCVPIIILCRMLFVAKPNNEFRRPMIGAPIFVGKTTDEDWPLEPIDIQDGVPFLIAEDYVLAGCPEATCHYLEWCVKNCLWNDYRYVPKAYSEKKQSLQQFLNVFANRRLSPRHLEFLHSQIEDPSVGASP